MATIKLPTPLRRFTNQQKTLEVEAATVREALDGLMAQFPDTRKVLFTEAGELKSFMRIFVGDRDIESLQGLDTPLSADSSIAVFPPIAGA